MTVQQKTQLAYKALLAGGASVNMAQIAECVSMSRQNLRQALERHGYMEKLQKRRASEVKKLKKGYEKLSTGNA